MKSFMFSEKLSFVKIIIACCLFVQLFSSCIPNKKIVYLQDRAEVEYKPLETITDKYFIQPNDYLFIRVNTLDPQLSDFFNPMGASSMQNMQGGRGTLFSYLVDDNYEIDFPYVGKIGFKACNVHMAKDSLEKALLPFVQGAEISVNLINHSFVIMGEVNSPGRIDLPKDQVTIFEALALAGDLAVTAKKEKVKLVRRVGNESKTYTINLLDADIVDSEFYYIYPNDMIYVEPMFAKKIGIGEAFSFSTITSLLALTLTIFALTR